MTTNLRALRDRATRPRRTVPLLLSGELNARAEALQAAMEASGKDRRLTTRTSTQAVDDLYAQAREATMFAVVEAMPTTLWAALIAEHPPRVDAEGKQLPEDRMFNTQTFPEPAIRGCLIGHKPDPDSDEVELVDDEFVTWLLGFVSDRQAQSLLQAVWDVNRVDDVNPLLVRPYATPASADA